MKRGREMDRPDEKRRKGKRKARGISGYTMRKRGSRSLLSKNQSRVGNKCGLLKGISLFNWGIQGMETRIGMGDRALAQIMPGNQLSLVLASRSFISITHSYILNFT